MNLRIASTLALLAGCGGTTAGAAGPTEPPPSTAVSQQAPRPEPPTVLLGATTLECEISTEENGRQVLAVTSGSGIAFAARVSPIVDGTMSLLGEEEGGEYRFTSHLVQPAEGELSGVGRVVIEELETRVTVALDGYRQEGGPGTSIRFTSTDMARTGTYVEFSGVAEAEDGTRHAFRVTLGAATEANGEVTPADANDESRIVSKAVYVEAPTTTTLVSLSTETTVERQP